MASPLQTAPACAVRGWFGLTHTYHGNAGYCLKPTRTASTRLLIFFLCTQGMTEQAKKKKEEKKEKEEKRKKGRQERTKCSKKIFIYQCDKTQGGMWCCAGSAGHWVCRKEEQLEALGRKRPVSTVTFNLIFNLLLCLQLVTTGINHLAGLIAISGSFILFVLTASLVPLVFGGVQFCPYFLLAVLVYQSNVVYFYARFLRLQYSHRFQWSYHSWPLQRVLQNNPWNIIAPNILEASEVSLIGTLCISLNFINVLISSRNGRMAALLSRIYFLVCKERKSDFQLYKNWNMEGR